MSNRGATLSEAFKALFGLFVFFGGLAFVVWIVYFWIKVIAHVEAWPL